MVRSSLFRRLSIVSLVLVMLGYAAAPAFAQLTAVIRGKVVDDKGQPVEGAEVKAEFLGDVNREWTVKTDKKGEYLHAGNAPGPWKITATKDKQVGVNPRINLDLNGITVPPIALGDAKKAAAAGMSAKEIEAANKKQTEMEADFNAAKLAFDSGNFDGAIAGLQKVLVNLPTCAACYISIGDAYNKKNDLANAEASYLKAIQLDPSKPAPYASLATIYNGQKKFDEAGKMGAKANELSEASGGGGDAGSVFNQGVILFNQGKMAEAEVQFAKATKLDPKMPDAWYQLGMSIVAQKGSVTPEAKTAWQEYLKIAPDGKYAQMVKDFIK